MAELMVGLLFLSIAVFGLVSVQFILARGAKKDERLHAGVLLASARMSEAEGKLKQTFDPAQVASPRSDWGNGYSGAIQASQASTNLIRVELSVYWTDPEGARSYDLWTAVLRP